MDNIKNIGDQSEVNVVIIGVHIVRCAELYYFPLVCHVTENTAILRVVKLLNLIYVSLFLTIYCHCLKW